MIFSSKINIQEIDKFVEGYKLAGLDFECKKLNFYKEFFSSLSTITGPQRQTHLFQKIDQLRYASGERHTRHFPLQTN